MNDPWRTLFVADAHLADSAYPDRGIIGDAYYSFEQAVDLAIAHNCDGIVAAGDLLDIPRNRPGPVNFLHRQLDRLRDADIGFEFIQGQPNHDQCDPPWAAGHPWAVHLHKTTRTLDDGFSYYGIDFQSRGCLQEELAEIPAGTDLLIAHQVWANWMGDVTNPQGEFAEIPIVYTVVTGDLHDFKLEKHRGKDGQEMTVCSPGSTAMQAINEPHQKYVVALLASGKLARVRLKTRRVHHSHVIDSEVELERFLDEGLILAKELIRSAAQEGLPEQLLKPMVEVSYHWDVPGVQRRTLAVLGPHCHLFFKELRPQKEAAFIGKDGTAVVGEAATPLGLLDQEVDPVQNPQAHGLLRRLLELRGKDLINQEVQKWRQEYLSKT